MATKTVNYFFVVYTFSDHSIIAEIYYLDQMISGQYLCAKYFEPKKVLTSQHLLALSQYERSSCLISAAMMSCVGCLLTGLMLPDT